METDAGLTCRRCTSPDAVRLPASVVYRQVSTRDIIFGRPCPMSRVVNISSYSRTASRSRPLTIQATTDRGDTTARSL
ncbi:hypothetical protein GCM10020295_78150 [Streptomyces cinereospinus]